MSYSVKSVSLGVFLWLRQAGNMDLFCNEVPTTRCPPHPYAHAPSFRPQASALVYSVASHALRRAYTPSNLGMSH